MYFRKIMYVRICAGACVYIPPNKRSFARTAIDQARNRANRGMIFPRKIAPVHFCVFRGIPPNKRSYARAAIDPGRIRKVRGMIFPNNTTLAPLPP